MKIVKPDYYDSFCCIANKCPLTCCQEWKIAVDDDTAKRWKNISAPEGTKPKRKKLDYFTTWKDENRVIALNREHQCPFLNREKLCNLVITYGEDTLSKTCQVFPREVHDYDSRKEYTLVPGCPAVIDLLKERKDFELSETGEPEEEVAKDVYTRIRDFFIDIMRRKDILPETGLLMIFYLALDLFEKEPITEEVFTEYLKSGIVEELQKTIENMGFDQLAVFEERNELFLDLAENYRKERMYESYLSEISELAECYAEGYDRAEIKEKLKAFHYEWKEYENLLRNLLCEELFAELLLPEEGLRHMVIKLQWLAMEYAVIFQSLFLQWDKTGSLTYEDVRAYIVILFRMTGYDEEDIYEYLENSFESLIWEWGYFALIVTPFF